MFKRYASLYFIAGVDPDDNELIVLDIIHQYVEVLDKYFGNVCELDLIFNFHLAYFILEEMLVGGHLIESSKKNVLKMVGQIDQQMDEAFFKDDGTKDGGTDDNKKKKK